MAVFGDLFGYRTGTGFVPAIATGAEYGTVPGDGGTGKVDLVLIGVDNGRRNKVTVGSGTVAQALAAEAADTSKPTVLNSQKGKAYLVDTEN